MDSFETVKNLLVPAFGACYCLPVSYPGANGYETNFNQVNIDSIPFLPQSVTVDCSDVPATETVTFLVKRINFKRIIRGGNTVTFNFPAVTNLDISITPSDLVSTVRAFYYNFPTFADFEGTMDVSFGGSSTVTIANTSLACDSVIMASDGTYFNPSDYVQTFNYNVDNTLNYIQVTVGAFNYRQSYTYSSGLVATISNWVKQ